jgi:Cu(I)/Ag(I) efflux system membrane fusion protein
MNMKQNAVLAAAVVAALLAGIAAGIFWSDRQQSPSPSSMEDTPTHQAGPFRVAASVDPQVPEVGENTVVIEVTDLNGEPVSDARIAAVATMPAMGAMAEMRAPATIRETAPGRYEGALTLPMDGSWPLTLEVGKEGVGQATLRFEMATRQAGLQRAPTGQPALEAGELEESPAGTITVDARRRQAIGLTLGEVQQIPMQHRVRAVGRVTYDETRVSDVALRFDAWIGELTADYVGVEVVAGETLFTVYGPDLLAAQQEYLEVKRRLENGALVDAAYKRLQLWNLTNAEIAVLERRGTPLDYVPIVAPRSGTVVTKNVVEGTAHRAGMTLMRIADLSQVWVEAEIYEADLGIVAIGMPVVVTLPYMPDYRFDGAVDYVYPFLDAQSRTVRIRVVIDNPGGLLKPDMYAEAVLAADLGERLAVPVDAVIFAGERRVVFEDLGGGRLAPRYVRTGFRAGELIEVVEGLEAGDRIVTSGTFLIASESRLQSGLDQW